MLLTCLRVVLGTCVRRKFKERRLKWWGIGRYVFFALAKSVVVQKSV